MGQPNAVGRIDIERLRLGGAFVTGSGVTHVAYAHVAAQFQHMTLLEDIAHQTGFLAQEDLVAVGGHDARSILTAVLQHRQRVIDALIDRAGARNTDDATHEKLLPGGRSRGVHGVAGGIASDTLN